ncbi:MAG: hypothetical protein LC803_20320 [Acidobacteria bacterium]|nr:hypothetical protein [Acidobacteriota bacterium]
MKLKSQKVIKLVAMSLVLSITQTYVALGETVRATAPAKAETAKAEVARESGNLLFGQLVLDEDKSISLNGNNAVTGTTILSGSQMSTPQAVEASVVLDSLGSLNIAPETDLTLVFDKASVNVVVAKGFASLNTVDGVKGSITLPEGDPTAAPQGGGGGGGIGLGNKKFILGAIGFSAIVAAAILVPCRRGRNPTPGEPRGRNNECRRGFAGFTS